MTAKEITNKIMENLQFGFSQYFNIQDSEGNSIKIRTSNHWSNRKNNANENVISFIKPSEDSNYSTNRDNMMIDEYEVDDNGDTDQFKSVLDIINDLIN
jgi:hypothetical protein